MNCHRRSAQNICNHAMKVQTMPQVTDAYGQPDSYVVGIETGYWVYRGRDGACLVEVSSGEIKSTHWQPK